MPTTNEKIAASKKQIKLLDDQIGFHQREAVRMTRERDDEIARHAELVRIGFDRGSRSEVKG